MTTGGQDKLNQALARRGATSRLLRNTGMRLPALRAIQVGRCPTVEQAVRFEALLGIPVLDWVPSLEARDPWTKPPD